MDPRSSGDAGSAGRWSVLHAGALTTAVVVVPGVLALLQAVAFEQGQTVGWLGIGPLIASLVLTSRRVAAISAYTLLVAGILIELHPGASTAADGVRLAVVAALAAFAVANCVIRERRETRLRQVSEVARVAQAAILRPVPRKLGKWSLAARYNSAAEEAAVGGDLLEVVRTPTGVRAIVGDVCGKGLPAVHLAATALATFRASCSQSGLSLTDVARRVDEAVADRAGAASFVTAVFVDFDDRGLVHIVNCGHPAPLRITPDGTLQPLAPAAPSCPLALTPSFHVETYPVGAGERLLVYTDGILEARDSAGEFFSVEQHGALLAAPDPDQVLDGLLELVEHHTRGRIQDDVALLLVCAESTDNGAIAAPRFSRSREAGHAMNVASAGR